MRDPSAILRAQLRTEKSTAILEPQRQYLFAVTPDANKIKIKHAIEQRFKVKVSAVNTMVVHGKWRRLRAQAGQRPDWKKAIVTLAEGHKIETT